MAVGSLVSVISIAQKITGTNVYAPLEIAQGRHTQYRRLAKRRLIQGIGRIGRTSSEKGICLLLFHPRGLPNFKKISKKSLKSLLDNST